MGTFRGGGRGWWKSLRTYFFLLGAGVDKYLQVHFVTKTKGHRHSNFDKIPMALNQGRLDFSWGRITTSLGGGGGGGLEGENLSGDFLPFHKWIIKFPPPFPYVHAPFRRGEISGKISSPSINEKENFPPSPLCARPLPSICPLAKDLLIYFSPF